MKAHLPYFLFVALLLIFYVPQAISTYNSFNFEISQGTCNSTNSPTYQNAYWTAVKKSKGSDESPSVMQIEYKDGKACVNSYSNQTAQDETHNSVASVDYFVEDESLYFSTDDYKYNNMSVYHIPVVHDKDEKWLYFPFVHSPNNYNCYTHKVESDHIQVKIPISFPADNIQKTPFKISLFGVPQQSENYFEASKVDFTWPKWEDSKDAVGVCVYKKFDLAFNITPYVMVGMEMENEDVATPVAVWAESVTKDGIQMCASLTDSRVNGTYFSQKQGNFNYAAYESFKPPRKFEPHQHKFTIYTDTSFTDSWVSFPTAFHNLFSNAYDYTNMEPKIDNFQGGYFAFGHSSYQFSFRSNSPNYTDWSNEFLSIANITDQHEFMIAVNNFFGGGLAKAMQQACNSHRVNNTYNYYCQKVDEFINNGNSFVCGPFEHRINNVCTCINGYGRTNGECVSCGKDFMSTNEVCIECPQGSTFYSPTGTCRCSDTNYAFENPSNMTCIKCSEPENYFTGICCERGVMDSQTEECGPKYDCPSDTTVEPNYGIACVCKNSSLWFVTTSRTCNEICPENTIPDTFKQCVPAPIPGTSSSQSSRVLQDASKKILPNYTFESHNSCNSGLSKYISKAQSSCNEFGYSNIYSSEFQLQNYFFSGNDIHFHNNTGIINCSKSIYSSQVPCTNVKPSYVATSNVVHIFMTEYGETSVRVIGSNVTGIVVGVIAVIIIFSVVGGYYYFKTRK